MAGQQQDKKIQRQVVKTILERFEEEPEVFKGQPVYDLIMERKNLADRERQYVEHMKKLQEEMAKKLQESTQEFMKLKGAIEYIEEKIVENTDYTK